jgi:hypothetical protein
MMAGSKRDVRRRRLALQQHRRPSRHALARPLSSWLGRIAGTRSQGLGSRVPGWRFATFAALLIAFSWQSVIAQTHQHFESSPVSAAAPATAANAGPQQPGRQSPSDLPANCPICHEIAHLGQVVMPAPFQLAAPVPADFFGAAAIPLGLTLTQRSHAWRSRGPPSQLQA